VIFRLARQLPVGVVRSPEGELTAEPGAQRVVHLRVVTSVVGSGRDPPADVDVVVEELLGELGAPAERVEIAATEIPAVPAAEAIPQGRALPELELVPDEVDVVEILGDGLGRPAPAASAVDQLDADVDATDVVGQVGPRDRRRDERRRGRVSRAARSRRGSWAS
jgi:hypothetical protein